jgi:ribosomal protein S6E (S10)
MGNPNKNPVKPNKKLKLLFSKNPGNSNKNLGKQNKKSVKSEKKVGEN